VTHILQRGAEWFAKIGRNEKNTGPKLYCISGHVNRPGVYEAAMGLQLKDLIFGDAYARGMKGGGRSRRSSLGASANMLTAPRSRTVRRLDGVAAKGSRSVGRDHVSERGHVSSTRRATSRSSSHESRGQCTPCREGTP
jgi:NADH-quinone oxidoreductase subunit F